MPSPLVGTPSCAQPNARCHIIRPRGAPLVGALPSPLVAAPSCAQPSARCHIIRPRGHPSWGALPPCGRPLVCPTQRLVAISSGPVGAPLGGALPSPPEAAPSCAQPNTRCHIIGPVGHPSWVPSPLEGAPSCAQPNARCHIIRPRGAPLVGALPLEGAPSCAQPKRSLPYHPAPWGTPRGCPPP